MFSEWLQLSIGLLIIAIICGKILGGLDFFLPLIIVGAIIYGLFHQGKGYAQADKDRQRRCTRR